jgi:hypothetical protein
MHSPFSVKRQQKNTEWEDRIKEFQISCIKVRQTLTTKTKGPVRTCWQLFEASTNWCDRIEHVGRHFEKAPATANGAALNEIFEQETAEYMIGRAPGDRITERRTSGGNRLHNDADGDIDGEDE